MSLTVFSGSTLSPEYHSRAVCAFARSGNPLESKGRLWRFVAVVVAVEIAHASCISHISHISHTSRTHLAHVAYTKAPCWWFAQCACPLAPGVTVAHSDQATRCPCICLQHAVDTPHVSISSTLLTPGAHTDNSRRRRGIEHLRMGFVGFVGLVVWWFGGFGAERRENAQENLMSRCSICRSVRGLFGIPCS